MTSNDTLQASGELSTQIRNIVVVTVALMTVTGMVAPAVALGEVGTLSSHVSVDVANDTITVGDTTQVTATANGTNVTTQATWTSSNTTVATVDSNGVVTAQNDGQTTINGSYDNDSDTTVVTVTESDPDPLPMSFYGNATIDNSPVPVGTTIEAEIDGEVRGSYTVDTSGEYGGAGPQEEQLVVSGEPGDDGATVTFYLDNGTRLEANETATWSEGATQELDLSAASPSVTGIDLSLAEDTITLNETTQATVQATFTDSSTANVTSAASISSNNTSVATVSSSGVVSPVGVGQATLTASHEGENDTAVITVVEADPSPLPASFYGTVQIDGSPAPAGTTIEAEIGGEVRGSITTAAAGQYGGPLPSDDQLVVSGEAGDDNATITFYVNNGNITRTQTVETATWSEGTTQELNLTAQVGALDSISLDLADSTITENATTQATVNATYTNGTTINVTDAATITSDDPGVATVSGSGLVTANGTGQANLTATYQTENDTAVLTVTEADPGPIPASYYGTLTIDGSPAPAGTTVEAEINGTVRGSITTTTSGEYGGPLPSDDQLIVNGSAGDENATVTFYVNSSGITRTQTAETDLWNAGTTTELNLTATVTTLESIDVTLANSTVTANDTTQATVTASYSDNTTADVTSSATFSSDDPGVATVDSSGIVSGVAAGQTNITADFNGESDAAVVTVVEDDPSPLPASFYGNLTVDGSPAAPGTTIEAEINGTVRGSITTAASGEYGGPLPTDDQLVVNGTAADDGATIEFYVNGTGFDRTQAPQTATWSEGDTTELDLSVSTIPGTLTGTVSDGTGTPIQNATVEADGTSTTTDATGTYTLNLSPGSYTATANASGYQSNATAVSITSNATTTQNFTLTAANATITGTVTDESGTPLPNATVDADGTSTTTDATGSYSVTVAPGTYNVSASLAGYDTNSTSVSVGPGATETQDFTLAAQNGTISGTVLEPAGDTVAGATVTIDGTGQSTTTAGDGTYTLTNVAPGTYDLTASLPDYDDGTATNVSVSPGASVTDVNLTITPQVVDLSVALANGTVTVGNTTQATVTATWANGTSDDVTDPATLSSDNATVATASATGVVTANAPGQTNISATYGNQTDSAVLTVVEADPAPLPASFYGDLTVDGSPGAAGTTIEAEINGTVRGSITTTAAGEYGGPLPSDDQLVVNGTTADDGATIEFYVNGTGFNRTQAAETATWSAGDTTQLNLTVSTTPGTLSGIVTDDAGTPLSNATVQAGGQTDTTDPSGSYSISLSPGSYTATANATNYRSDSAPVSIVSNATTTQNFTLTPQNGSISGTVSDGAGQALSGATVTIDGTGQTATTAGDGTYTLANVSPGTYDLTASLAGYSDDVTTNLTVDPDEDVTNANFTLVAQNGSISGTVSDQAGADLAGATVTIDGTGQTASSAGDGTYTLANVSPGTYDLTASLAGYSDDTVTNVTVDPGETVVDVNVTLVAQNGSISGTVTNQAGNDLSGATVTIDSTGQTATTAGDGTYTLANVSPGAYNLSASLTGYASDAVTNVTVDPGETVTGVNFTLVAQNGTISGTVTDQAGNDLSGATVTIDSTGQTATTDANGTYTLANVSPGAYNLSASLTGYASDAVTNVTVDPGETVTDVNFTLVAQNGSVSGTVVDQAGDDLAGATVTVDSTGQTATTDANGTYTLANVSSGTYDLTASLAGYSDDTTTNLTVDPGETVTDVNFTLVAQNGSISGAVEDQDGNDLSSVTVTIDGTGQTAMSAGDGTYTLANVSPGTYDLTASLANYTDDTVTNVTVDPGQDVMNVNFTLTELTGTVTGTVTNSSNTSGLSGATVEVLGTGQTATTNATGAYTITNVTPGTYDIHADATDFVAQTQQNVTVPANGSVTADFALVPSEGTISGIVLDDEGTPVEDVTVATPNSSVTTDASGSYSLDEAFGTFTVTATKTGYDNDSAMVEINASSPTATQNFTVVAQNGSISGTVTDDDGTTLASATVTIDSTGQSATTNATGAYTIPDVEPGTYNLTASLANYTDDSVTNVTVGPGEAVTNVDFALTAQVVDIDVTLADDSLEVGNTTQATVTATWANGTSQEVTSSASFSSANTSIATVNASGVVTAVGEGQADISATYAGLTDAVPVTVADDPAPLPASYYGSITIDGDAAPANVTVEAEINGTVRGSLTTTSAGAYGGPDPGDARLDVPGTVADANATVTFYVNGTGFDRTQATETTQWQAGVTEQVNLSLTTPPGTITGTVTDTNGTAVANATVTIPSTGATTTTNATGSYTLSPTFGDYTVTADKMGYDGDSANVTVVANETTTQNFTLAAQNGSISGTVTDQAGDDLSGATVTIDATGQSATTDANGTYTLANVSPGTYNLTASLAGYDDDTTTVTVGPGEAVTNANLTLAPQNGSISGTVDDQAGDALSGATVTIGSTGQTATTDANGTYTITNVTPDDYTLTASLAGYDSDSVNVTVDPGEAVTDANLTLVAQNGSISGTVSDAAGDELANATVTIDATGQSATTDGTGAYTLANVSPGTYNLTASLAGYDDGTATVTVDPGEAVTDANLSLAAQNGTISGTVTDQDGDDLANATVTIDSTGQSVTTDANGTYTIADVEPGTYDLTATLAGYDADATTNVTVGPGEDVTNVTFTLEVQLVDLSIDLAEDWLEVGETTNATVTAHYADNSTATVTTNATYGTTDTAVATVDSTGLVTATGEGQANITATFQNQSAEVPITVADDPAPLPMTLYGALEVDGSPAPANVTIEAEINGTVRGSITTDSVGSYGGPNAGDGKLLINGTAADQNATISFYLNHSSFAERLVAVPSTTWSAGTTLEHNLSASTDPGTITGTVTDGEGDVLPNATVDIAETGQSTTTNASGQYAIDVGFGTYNVTASLPGYDSQTAQVSLVSNETVTQNFTLTAQNGTVSGTVTDAMSGDPIDNALVTLETGQSTATDANGTYSIANVVPGTHNLTVDHPNYAQNTTSVSVGPNESVTADVMLAPLDGSISGTVEDQAGDTLSGATVTIDATGQTATTDGTGAYTLANVSPGTYNLTASLAGYDDATVTNVTVDPGEAVTDVNLTLVAQNGSISGTVSDQAGDELAGATVEIDSTGQSATTDANGTYTLANVSPGTYNLTASLAGYDDATVTNVTVAPGEAVTDVNVTLAAQNGSVSGTVTDQAGDDLSGATVTIDGTGQTATSAGDGTYTLGNVSPGTYNLTASLAGYDDDTATVTVDPGETVTDVNFTLVAQNGSISGTVTDQAGDELANATVTIDSTGQSATTDANGTYTLANVSPGTYNLTASLAGYDDGTATVTVDPGEAVVDANLTLTAQNGTISGAVEDQDGDDLSSVTVTIDGTGQTATSAGDGTYTIANVSPGTYDLTASLSNYTDDSVTNVTVDPGQDVMNVNFTLTELTGTVTGTVTNSSNASALAGATVEVLGTGLSATTNATGAYTITNVSPGTYDIHADATGFVAQTDQNVTVPANGSVTADFALDPSEGTMSGIVLDDEGTPVEDVTVETPNTSTTTDASGSYTLDEAFGTHNVTATKPGYDGDSATVEINASSPTVTQNFTVVAQNGSISGTVTGDTGSALSGATVTIDSTGQTATTNATGAYTIPAVEPGSYNLTASLANYTDDAVSNVTVDPGEAVSNVDFALTAQVVDVDVTLADDSLQVGDTTQATVTATWANGTTEPVTTAATLTSDDAGIATVNASGVVTAQAEGQTDISATYAGLMDAVPVTVADDPAPLPASYYGSITIDGEPAPANLTVEAEINGTVRGSLTTASPGAYGGAGPGDTRLDVPGTVADANATVTFYVNGTGFDRTQALETTQWQAGVTEQVNLTLTTPAGTITGTVTDTNGSAIANATVTIPSTGANTTTDASGTYSLSATFGNYTVTANKMGYDGDSANVTVVANETTTQDFTLAAQNGSVSGTVSDQAGDDLSGATVTIDATGQSATTDANGTYTLANVSPGTYNLTASLAGYDDATATVAVDPGEAVMDANFTLAQLDGTVTGTVTNSSDTTPVAGAIVEVVGTGQTATTNASGGYTIENVTPGTYDIQADAPGYVAETQTNVTVPAGGTATADFALDPAEGTITGTVLDDEGTPLEDVTVAAANSSVTTDASGAYTLNVPFGTHNVTATKMGYDSDMATVELNASSPTATQNFTLVAQNGSISGTVADDDGTTLANATVTIDSTGQSATTNATGAYTIPDVEPGTYNLTASLANYTDDSVTNVTVDPGEAVTNVDFALTAQVVDVDVTLADDSLQVGDTTQATVTATWANGTSETVTSSATLGTDNATVATVNASGVVTAQAAGQTNITATYAGITGAAAVTVTDVPAPLPARYYGTITIDGEPAPANLTVEAEINGTVRGSITTMAPGAYGGPGAGDPQLEVPGTAADVNATVTFYVNGTGFDRTQAAETTQWQSAEEQVNLSLTTPPGTIAGTVTDTNGSPVANATVTIPSTGANTTTDASGNYSLPATFGDYTVTADKMGYDGEMANVTVVSNETTTQDFTLVAQNGSISGTVTDQAGDELANATVEIDATGQTATTAGDGTYTLANVSPGTYDLTASLAGYDDATATVTVDPGEAVMNTNFTLVAQNGSISGTVDDQDGNALSGATVTIDSTGQTVMTAGNGTYTLANVSPGTYDLTASLANYTDDTVTNVTVTPGEDVVDVNFTLAQLEGTVTGTVTNSSNGSALAGATVEVLATGQTATTNASGGYTITNVTPGTYEVQADAAGFVAQTQNVTVPANDSVTADFALQPAEGTITGTVLDADGDPVEDVTVATLTTSTTTDANGSYTIEEVFATHNMTATKPGYDGDAAIVEINASSPTATQNFTVSAQNGSISGTVTDDAATELANATVTITETGETTSTDANGSYSFANVTPDDYTLTASLAGYDDDTVTVTVDPGEDVSQDFALVAQNGSISGTVTDQTGQAVDNATVAIDGTGQTVTTAVNGTYTIPDVEPGTYNLTASKVNYDNGSAINVTVDPGEDRTDVDITMAAHDGSIAGFVMNRTGGAIEDAEVEVDGTALNATTDANGSYTIDNVTPGTYNLTASGPQGSGLLDNTSVFVTVDPGEALTGVNITLSPPVGPPPPPPGGGGPGDGQTQEPTSTDAEISVEPSPPMAGEPVQLSGLTSSVSAGALIAWDWEVDGETLSGEEVTYTFDEPGTYDVTLTVTGDLGTSDTTTVTVEVIGIESIDATVEESELQIGNTTELSVEATYTDGSTEDVTDDASFSSSDSGVVTVTGTTVTAEGAGEATIDVTYENASDSVSITVEEPPEPEGEGLHLLGLIISLLALLSGGFILIRNWA